jgi:hypothetical protein
VGKHNIFRDGMIHVMAEECATCIFRPATRPVDGARVAGMVRETADIDGATVVCHSTLYRGKPHRHAICKGWFDRLGDRDGVLRLAVALNRIHYQELETRP